MTNRRMPHQPWLLTAATLGLLLVGAPTGSSIAPSKEDVEKIIEDLGVWCAPGIAWVPEDIPVIGYPFVRSGLSIKIDYAYGSFGWLEEVRDDDEGVPHVGYLSYGYIARGWCEEAAGGGDPADLRLEWVLCQIQCPP